MPRLIPLAGPLAIGAGVLALGGCSADTADFQDQGERFLEGDEVRERFGTVRMSDAECDEPANTDKDTAYSCTATGSDGNTWGFTIEITGSTSLRVIRGEVVTPGSVPGSNETTAPADSSQPTTTAAAGPTTTGGGSTSIAPTTGAPGSTAAPSTAVPSPTAAATTLAATTTAAG